PGGGDGPRRRGPSYPPRRIPLASPASMAGRRPPSACSRPDGVEILGPSVQNQGEGTAAGGTAADGAPRAILSAAAGGGSGARDRSDERRGASMIGNY